jgi:hypothetical protein
MIFFSDDDLKRGDVEVCLGQQMLEPGVLLLKRLQRSYVAALQPAVLRPPAPQRVGANLVLARAQLAGLHAGLGLFQDRDDLLVGEPRLARISLLLLLLLPLAGGGLPDFWSSGTPVSSRLSGPSEGGPHVPQTPLAGIDCEGLTAGRIRYADR